MATETLHYETARHAQQLFNGDPKNLKIMAPGHTFAQEAPPETTTIRLIRNPGICVAPQYVADELLRAEGFTDIQRSFRDSARITRYSSIGFEYDRFAVGRTAKRCESGARRRTAAPR